jgi:hypothetical protein
MGLLDFFIKIKERHEEKINQEKKQFQQEIKKIVDLMPSKSDYKEALKEVEKVRDKLDDGKYDHTESSDARRYLKIMYAALKIVEIRGYEWQFLPNLDVYLPVEILDDIYERINDKVDYDRLESISPGSCIALDIDYPSDDLEDKPEGLLQFKALIESLNSKEDIEERASAIDLWILKNNSIADDYGIPTGNEYLLSELIQSGVPRPMIMIEHGYNTVQKCRSLKIDEYKSWKGIGDKSVKKFSDFLLNN